MTIMWAMILFGIAMMVDSSFILGMSFVLSIMVIIKNLKT